jgi:hypothetical protein
MKKWTVGLALLGCALGFFALLVTSRAGAAQSHDSEADRVTVEGCLSRSGWQYFLDEKDGTREQLTGYQKLKDFVGHEIQISGVRTVKTIDNTPPGGSSSVIMQPVINVKMVKDLGKGCSTN